MFKKSLNDLVKGIRSNKKNPEPFIKQSLQEIRSELKSDSVNTKAVAVQKLTYLHMMGYDMEWAAFHFLELMTQPAFHHKRIGYLAASHAFTPETEVLVMTPQLLRKDLKNPDQYINGQAMNCLANIVTESLGTEMVSEVVTLLSSARPYVRKRAVTLLFKIFLQYPAALRPTFPKIQEKLKDNHPSVQACAVNVICELAVKNPKNYLPLAPVLYNLLRTLHNNWTLIKIVKLLGTLTPHEKRLGKKLVEPMIDIITHTQAKSLLYECCYTVTKGMQKHMTVVKLAVEKLKEFVEDSDQNLKYLGLLGLNNLMNRYPRIIADLKSEILACLHDEDVTIRYRAVDLMCGVITPKNIKGIMKRLLAAIDDSNDYDYKNFLIERIIQACSRENYENIQSFRWYIRTLLALSEVKGLKHPDLISEQFMDVLIRVKSIRPYGVDKMVDLLHDLEYNPASNNGSILSSAAWLLGEFISEFDEDLMDALDALTADRLSSLPPQIQARFITAILKVYAEACVRGRPKEMNLLEVDGENAAKEEEAGEDDEDRLTPEAYNELLTEMRQKIRDSLETVHSSDVEVQERVAHTHSILDLHEASMSSGSGNLADDVAALFGEELNPVAKSAQAKVPVPEGLDLDTWIGEPFKSSLDNIDDIIDDSWDERPAQDLSAPTDGLTDSDFQGIGGDSQFQGVGKSTYQQHSSVFVLPSGPSQNDVLDPSVSKIIDARGETAIKIQAEDKKKKKKKKRRHRRRRAKIEEAPAVITADEMPEGAEADKSENPKTSQSVRDKLSSIDLSKPITDADALPTVQSYPLKTEDKKQDPKAVEKELSPVDQEKKERKRKHRKHRHDRDGEKKKKHRKHKHKKHRRSKQQASVDQFFDAPKEEGKPKSRLSKQFIASDDQVDLFFNAKGKPTTVENLVLPLTVVNKSDATLENLTFTINSEGNITWLKEEEVSESQEICSQLEAGSKQEFKINIKVDDWLQKMDVLGSLTYIKESDDEEASKDVLEFSVLVPSSMWMEPKIIEAEDLGTLISNKKLEHKASGKFKLTESYPSVDHVAKEVCRKMRFAVVQRIEGQAYNLYSHSLFGDEHVAAQIKSSDGEVSVDLKGSNEPLIGSYLRQLSKML